METMEQLILLGVSLDARYGRFNQTLLHFTTRYSSIKVAQLLLKHNAEINPRDVSNRTPLHDAAYHNSTKLGGGTNVVSI